mgnify:CR=1 FL=1
MAGIIVIARGRPSRQRACEVVSIHATVICELREAEGRQHTCEVRVVVEGDVGQLLERGQR